jgi:glycosyltransferase involved in cell wall biosynthesis
VSAHSQAPLVAVNGRFLTRPVTGVERYAREILTRLPLALDGDAAVIVPPNRITGPERAGSVDTEPWTGLKGHRWEQFVLPRLVKALGADLLLSPCNHGPLRSRSQLVVLHDLLPLRFPQFFSRPYSRWTRVASGTLARTSRRVVTVSERSRDEIVELLEVPASKIDVVPPGVGAPFTEIPLDDIPDRLGTYCIFVGSNDARKNLGFVLSFWDRVWKELGIELHLVRQVPAASIAEPVEVERPGVVVHNSPDDHSLARLYAGALCLVWPSRHEGFGIPLLECSATGTPFLGTDVGGASLVASADEQILPLDPELWVERLREWSTSDISELRRRSAARAREFTWEASAAGLARSIERCLE